MPMNIHAKPGDKVRFANQTNGNSLDRVQCRQYLHPGGVYTVDTCEVCSSYTNVTLVEVPGRVFNSVMFDDEPAPVLTREDMNPELANLVDRLSSDALSQAAQVVGSHTGLIPLVGEDRERLNLDVLVGRVNALEVAVRVDIPKQVAARWTELESMNNRVSAIGRAVDDHDVRINAIEEAAGDPPGYGGLDARVGALEQGMRRLDSDMALIRDTVCPPQGVPLPNHTDANRVLSEMVRLLRFQARLLHGAGDHRIAAMLDDCALLPDRIASATGWIGQPPTEPSGVPAPPKETCPAGARECSCEYGWRDDFDPAIHAFDPYCKVHGGSTPTGPTDVRGLDLSLHGESDATVWAREFCRVAEGLGHILNEDWVCSWFANAIMAGWDTGRARLLESLKPTDSPNLAGFPDFWQSQLTPGTHAMRLKVGRLLLAADGPAALAICDLCEQAWNRALVWYAGGGPGMYVP